MNPSSKWSEARIRFEKEEIGVYIYIYLTPTSAFPEYDYLQDNMEIAVSFCLDDLGIPKEVVEAALAASSA